jgi:hypothetical protein
VAELGRVAGRTTVLDGGPTLLEKRLLAGLTLTMPAASNPKSRKFRPFSGVCCTWPESTTELVALDSAFSSASVATGFRLANQPLGFLGKNDLCASDRRAGIVPNHATQGPLTDMVCARIGAERTKSSANVIRSSTIQLWGLKFGLSRRGPLKTYRSGAMIESNASRFWCASDACVFSYRTFP